MCVVYKYRYTTKFIILESSVMLLPYLSCFCVFNSWNQQYFIMHYKRFYVTMYMMIVLALFMAIVLASVHITLYHLFPHVSALVCTWLLIFLIFFIHFSYRTLPCCMNNILANVHPTFSAPLAKCLRYVCMINSSQYFKSSIL